MLVTAREWGQLVAPVIAAVLVSLGIDQGDVKAPEFERAATANCDATNDTKALARELIAISPIDPDVTPTERQAFQARVAELTRPRDCEALVGP